MAFDPKDNKTWHDFAHTTAVLLSSALAEFEAGRGSERASGRVFDFELLAAASEDVFHFTDGELLAREGGMQASIKGDGEHLRLELQLIGFASLEEGAGQNARLCSEDGTINEEMRFDKKGATACALADQAEVRRALARFTVEILPQKRDVAP